MAPRPFRHVHPPCDDFLEVFPKMKKTFLLLSFSLTAMLLHAQTASDPLSAGNKGIYNIVKNNVVKAAEKMPEENYAFKPTPEVRSFGQLIGHVSDAQYAFC